MDSQKTYVTDIYEGAEISSLFLVEEPRLGRTKSGNPYVGLKLKDSTGRIEARVWNRADEFFSTLKDGDLALIHGVGESFNGQIQINVSRFEKKEIEAQDLSDFLPASPRDAVEMMSEFLELIDSVSDADIKWLLQTIFTDPEIADDFKIAPAAKRFHHAYVSGLLEHTLSVARAADAVSNLYPTINRDLLLAGAMLHDLGKIKEFSLGANPDYSTPGRLLGHIALGLELIQSKLAAKPDFPEEPAQLIKHMILSHHGEYEMGSPRKPKTIEALALHYLDELDAKINGIGSFIEKHADKDTGWTDFNRLMDRFFFRPEMDRTEEASPAESSSLSDDIGGERAKPSDGETEKKGADQLSLLGE